MKKILLTGIAAVFFAIGSMAQTQQQKNKSTESNQYRKGNESRTKQRVDSVGNTIDSNAEKTGRDIKQDVKRTGNEIDRSAEQAGQNMKEGAQRTEDSVQQGAQRTGQSIQSGAERTGNTVREGVNNTGDAIQNGAQRTQDQMNQSTPQEEKNQSQNSSMRNSSRGNNDSMNGNAAATDANTTTQNPVEVVDSKEGPNNEVVYKYQGELYYIDRKEQKLVKAEESQLKDAKNKAVVSTNPVSTDSKTSKMKNRKSTKG
jgi:hypothetical protein